MRKSLLALTLGVSLVTVSACSGDASSGETGDEAPEETSEAEEKIAKEIVDLGMPKDRREEIFLSTMDEMMKQMREATERSTGGADEGIKAITDKYIEKFKDDASETLKKHIPDLMDAMATSYTETFTQAQLEDIRDFVSTPSGQKFFELQPKVITSPAYAEANQEYMRDILQLVGPMQMSMSEELNQYFQEKGIRPGMAPAPAPVR